jgi:GSH-dependent disulfide-bond oxidoreductase
MIDLHYAPTPNGWKISIMLEELGLPYTVIPVNIRAGDQFKPEFLAISPNNRIPAIVDHAPADGGGPFSVFETGAILIYLADKAGRFLPQESLGQSRARPQVQAGLAIGKFVKEPFDEEARRNMFGQAAKEAAGK